MARNFNGTSNYLGTSNFDQLDGSAEMSIAAWVWKDVLDNDLSIFAADSSSNSVIFWYNIVGAPNTNCFTFNVGNTATGTNRVDSTTDSANPAGQQWCHVVGTMNGASRKIYINGVLDASHSNAPQTTVPNMTNVRIGGWDQSTGLSGEDDNIAEIGIWDRELSDGEIAGLATGVQPLVYASGMVAYLPLVRGENNLVSGASFSTVGSVPTFDPHPRVFSGGGDI